MKGKLNMEKNLLELDLQLFGEEEVETTGENEVEETAEPQEEETTEAVNDETGEENGDAEPHEQTAEENARYAAIRRRAEEDARRKYDTEINTLNQQVAAMCRGITHPLTGQPITNVRDYMDALQIQQRQASEAELQEKGIDPALIDRMVASNPTVMQAQRVIEQAQMTEAETQIQKDVAELGKYDPNIKSVADLATLPNFSEIIDRVSQGLSLVEAYKMVNFDNFMQHTNEAARQQAINQMRGKSHLPSQSTGVATDNDEVEVPAEIMASWKSEGKTEKQIRDLYKTVTNKLHLN